MIELAAVNSMTHFTRLTAARAALWSSFACPIIVSRKSLNLLALSHRSFSVSLSHCGLPSDVCGFRGMEHSCPCNFLGDSFVTRWTACELGILSQRDQQAFAAIVNAFGRLSAAAQGLKTPITDIAKLVSSEDTLYLAAQTRGPDRAVVYGGLKVGPRRLWVWPPGERCQREVGATCVLDFYVHESVQRVGVGRQLFEAALSDLGCPPSMLAYDRPSAKCKAFLQKHYGLDSPISMSNNFVVFPSFFQSLHPPQAQRPSCWASVTSRPLTSKGRRQAGLSPASASLSPNANRCSPWQDSMGVVAMPSLAPCPPGGSPSFAAAPAAGQAGEYMGPGSGSSSYYSSMVAQQPREMGHAGSWNAAPVSPSMNNPQADLPSPPANAGWAQLSAPREQQQPHQGNSRWQENQEGNGSPHAADSLPPLRPAGGKRHFMGATASPTSPQLTAARPHFALSPMGQAQRAGAGASACLRW